MNSVSWRQPCCGFVSTLERVRQLTPVLFRYRAEIEAGAPLRAGFVAQQVQEVFPDVVHDVGGALVLDLPRLRGYVQQALRELQQDSAS